MTEEQQSEEVIDYETTRLFAMYAAGVAVIDIALAFGWSSPQTVYSRLNYFPEEYKVSKQLLLEKRIAIHRRVGAKSIDFQLKYLDGINTEDQEELSKEMSTIIKIGETAEKRADLNEGNATEIIQTKDTSVVLTVQEMKARIAETEQAGNGIDGIS